MKKEGLKIPVTLKVILGYSAIIILAVYSIWFVYGQIESLSQSIETNNEDRLRHLRIGEIATNLFAAESMSRDIIQNQKNDSLAPFEKKIDTIHHLIHQLRNNYENVEMNVALDSFDLLLTQKNLNLKELLELRENAYTESYYAKVISQLQKLDHNFEDENYEWQLRNHDPRVRRAIIGLIEYSKENRKGELTQKTADSLINSLKNVLNSLERQERRIMQTIKEKENELLENDRFLSSQLQDIRYKIEQEEINKGMANVLYSKNLVERTSTVIVILGIISVVTMLFFVTMIFYDIHRSQTYRKQLEEAKNYSESLLRHREQIMNTVTHDLRSPLNSVIGYTDLLEKTPLTHQQKQYLKNLKTSSDYILNLVNDLLDISKLNSGKISTQNHRFNLQAVIQNAAKTVIPENNPKKIKLTVTTHPEFERDIISDSFRIHQVLANLISNAYKFTPQGEIKITADYVPKNNRPRMAIAVQDTGIGISKALQKEVFREFSQVQREDGLKHEGFGLGLSISKKIVQLLGGEISLKSEIDKGSTFTVTLPFEFATDQQAPQTPPPATTRQPITEQAQILIIDDDPVQLALTSEILKPTGIATDCVTSVDQALMALDKKPYALILTDIQMPQRDGFNFLQVVQQSKNHAQLPVIAISGRTDLDHQEYLNAGFSGHLVKPFRPDSLYELLENYFEITHPLPNPEEASLSGNNELYDLSDLYYFTDGDTASLQMIVKTFIENSRENLVTIQSCLSENNTTQISAIIHKMLPMYRQLKIQQVIPLMERLEQDKIPLDDLPITIQALSEKIYHVLNTLEAEVS